MLDVEKKLLERAVEVLSAAYREDDIDFMRSAVLRAKLLVRETLE